MFNGTLPSTTGAAPEHAAECPDKYVTTYAAERDRAKELPAPLYFCVVCIVLIDICGRRWLGAKPGAARRYI